MKLAIQTAALFAALALPCSAQAQTADQIAGTDVIRGFTMETLKAIARYDQHTIVEQYDDSMQMIIENTDGWRVLLEGRTCGEPINGMCESLLVQLRFNDMSDVDPVLLSRISADFIAAEAYFEDDGTMVIERYVLLREGMTVDNLAFNIRVTAEAWKAMRPYILGEVPLDQ